MPTNAAAFSATEDGECCLEREDLDLVLRALRVERLAVQERAFAAVRRPLLARTEVVDVGELDVGHRVAVRDRDREREERNAALRVERAVDRIDDDAPSPVTDLADLLGDDRDVETVETRKDHALRCCVDRRCVVTALALRKHGLALGTRRKLGQYATHVVRGAAADREPVSQAGRREDR